MSDTKEVYKGTMENGVEYKVSESSNPFNESYLIVTIDGVQVVGMVIDKKKTGTIVARHKISGAINIKGKDVAAAAPVAKSPEDF